MLIRSPFQCGYSREGRAVLQEGVNDLDVAKLSDSEKLFVDELVAAKIVEVIDVAAAPESGHRLLAPVPPALESAELDDDFGIVFTTTPPTPEQRETRTLPDIQISMPVTTAAAARAGRKRK